MKHELSVDNLENSPNTSL